MLIHGSLQSRSIIVAIALDAQRANVDPLVHGRQRRNVAGNHRCGLLKRRFLVTTHDARLATVIADFQPRGQVIDDIVSRWCVDWLAARQEVWHIAAGGVFQRDLVPHIFVVAELDCGDLDVLHAQIATIKLFDLPLRDLDCHGHVQRSLQRISVKPTSWVRIPAADWPSNVESISKNCQLGDVFFVMIPYLPPYTCTSLAWLPMSSMAARAVPKWKSMWVRKLCWAT